MCPLLASHFFTFWLPPLAMLMRQTRQAVHAINQSIFLRCLWVKIHRHLRKAEQWPKLQEIVVSVASAKVMVPHSVTRQPKELSWHSQPSTYPEHSHWWVKLTKVFWNFIFCPKKQVKKIKYRFPILHINTHFWINKSCCIYIYFLLLALP